MLSVVRLSDHEAWTQGMRVHPEYRGRVVARTMDADCRDWARDRGATVARNMVFSWNAAGLATARSLGYRPRAEFRWVHPDPAEAGDAKDGVAETDGFDVVDEPAEAWSYWQRSDARSTRSAD